MKNRIRLLLTFSLLAASMHAQTAPAPAQVPKLVKFSGVLNDAGGKPLTGLVGVTFSLYKDEQGGAPLWLETQNVQVNSTGHFSVMLGASTPEGVPADLFAAEQAHWLGVQAAGQAEQPRVFLVSVPYALKAVDADTVGGLPAAAFVLAAPASQSGATTASANALAPAGNLLTASVTGTGTTNFVPLWTSSSTLGNSVVFQSGSGVTAKVGIGTTSPGTKLDVNGGMNIEGLFKLPAAGSATSAAGTNSQPQQFVASSFNSMTHAAVNQSFQWQAEPAGNNTASPSGTLNLLFASGASAPAETGLKLSNKGIFSFAAGQTFPGTGTIAGVITANGSGLTGGGTSGTLNLSLSKTCASHQILQWNGTAWACANAATGTITGVTAGTDLTGGGTNGIVTLNLDTTKVPQLAAANTFTANQTIHGNLSTTGSVSGGTASFSGNVKTAGSFVATGYVDGFGATFNGSGFPVVYVLENGTSGEALLATSSNVAGGEAVIDGEANGTTGATYGLLGNNVSSSNFATGVLGQNFSSSGITFGVEGISNSSINGPRGVGVFGVNSFQSNTAGLFLGNNPVGVWGDTGSFGAGVYATADEGYALAATNNSPTGSYTGTFDNLQSSTHNLYVLVAEGAFGYCAEDTDGNLGCTGSKSAIVPMDDGQRQVALYAVEAPQNWFEDFGSGQLSNGSATIRLDPAFAQTVNAVSEYHVFLTPEEDCEGLYVSQKTPTSFESTNSGAGDRTWLSITALWLSAKAMSRFAWQTRRTNGSSCSSTGRMRAQPRRRGCQYPFRGRSQFLKCRVSRDRNNRGPIQAELEWGVLL